MRTLKKALSLVLVLAMVFALAVPGFAADTTKKASDFKDYSKVTNKEAVDVLTAIGVINGNADGTFAPEGNFTRAEAATMITYLTLGKTVADALPTSATKFSDVPATHWAAKYVQYCADAGIVNGVGNGKFDPDAKLTATQWALMLLGALGYNAKNEGIGGAGWEIATTKLAMKAGVATASELTGTFNRDMAAKFALNTLKANVVEYESNGTNITIGDTTISTGASKATVVTSKEEYAKNFSDKKNADDTYNVQFGEQHFTGLKATTSDETDSLGRPATKWTLNKDTNVISTGAAKATLTYTTKVSEKDMAKELKGYTFESGLKNTVNGTAAATAVTKSDEVAALTGNGKTVEIFATEGKIIAIAVVEPTFGEVTVKNVAATKSHGAYTEYTVGGKPYKVFSTVVADDDKTTATVNGTVANKDMVLYYVDKDKNATITAVSTVSGVLSKVSSTGVYTIDGTSYKLAAAGDASKLSISKNSQTFYVDADNNLLGTKVGAAPEYVMVIDVDTVSTLKDNKIVSTNTATVVRADGKVETVNAYKGVDADAETENIETLKGLKGKVVTITEGANGAVLGTAEKGTTVTGLTKGNSTLVANKLYANANTLFVFVNYKADGKTPSGTVTTYTGIANVPTIGDNGIKALDTNDDKIADVVYVYGNAMATTTDSYVYVIGTWTQTGTDTYAWDVIKDGKETTITLDKDGKLDAHTLYSKITVNGTVLDTGADKTVKATGGEDKAVVANKGGLLFVKETLVSKKYTDSTPIYVVDTADDTVTTTAFADLTTTVEGTAYVVTDSADANVLAVYVVYNSSVK